MPAIEPPSETVVDRRSIVLDAALITFARFGFRKTSMDEIARAAHISRPGLYFLFDSKDDLFRAAVTKGLEDDLAAVERILGESGKPIAQRLLAAFDQWAGRYIGPMTSDMTSVVAENPQLLGDLVTVMPERFVGLVAATLGASRAGVNARRARALADTLVSTSIGIKHQVSERADYARHLAVAIDLLLG